MRPKHHSPKIRSFRSQYYGIQPVIQNRTSSQQKSIQSYNGNKNIKSSSLSSNKIKQKISKLSIKAMPQRLSIQISVLKREVQRLQKENDRKSRQIIQMKNQTLNSKVLETEIKQLYSVISYYQGKIKQIQHQLSTFFHQLLSQSDSDIQFQLPQIQQVIKSLSHGNKQLSAKLQQSKQQKQQLQKKIRKYQSKYYDSTWKLSATKRIFRQSQKSNRIANSLEVQGYIKPAILQQQSMINKFSKKIQSIQTQLQQFRRQNDQLHQQLQLKEKEIQKLKKEMQTISKISYSQQSNLYGYGISQPINPISTPSKRSLAQDKQRNNSKKVINTVSKKEIKQQIQQQNISKKRNQKLRKLRFQLMLSPLSYSQFIQIVKDKFQDQYQLSQTLKAYPYSITSQSIIALNYQLSSIKQNHQHQKSYGKGSLQTKISKFLNTSILPYKNIIKDDHSKSSGYQKAKDAMNVFYEELNHFRAKNNEKIPSFIFQDALRDFGCKQTDIDTILLYAFLKGMIEQIDLSKLWKIFGISLQPPKDLLN